VNRWQVWLSGGADAPVCASSITEVGLAVAALASPIEAAGYRGSWAMLPLFGESLLTMVFERADGARQHVCIRAERQEEE
jgi:hypothetical protein